MIKPMARFYALKNEFFENKWQLPDVKKIATTIGSGARRGSVGSHRYRVSEKCNPSEFFIKKFLKLNWNCSEAGDCTRILPKIPQRSIAQMPKVDAGIKVRRRLTLHEPRELEVRAEVELAVLLYARAEDHNFATSVAP